MKRINAALRALATCIGPPIVIGWQLNNGWYALALFLFQMNLLLLAQCYGRKK